MAGRGWPASAQAGFGPGWFRHRQGGGLERAEPIGPEAGHVTGTLALPVLRPGLAASGLATPFAYRRPYRRAVPEDLLDGRASPTGRNGPSHRTVVASARSNPSLQGRSLVPDRR